MALDFPYPPTLNATYGRWRFDGQAWVLRDDPAAPFVSKAGDTMGGALEVMFGTPPGDDDATPKKYVDDAIAATALYQGTWVVATNTPDLTQTALQHNGWAWVAITTDPHTLEATTVALPGVPIGTMVGNGDRIVWSTGDAAFALIRSPGLTQTEADARFVQLAGSTMTGALTLSGNTAAAPAGNLQPVPLQQMNTALGNYVLKAGDTMTGSLAITGATSDLSVSRDATVTRDLTVTRASSFGAPTTPLTTVGSVNTSNNFYINGEAVPTAARLNALGIVRGRGGSTTYQGTAGDQFREVAQITVNTTAGNQMGTYALPISSVHGNGSSYRFIRCPVFAMGFGTAPNLTYAGDLYERTSGNIYGRLWIKRDDTVTNMWRVAVSLGQYVDITVGTLSALSMQNLPAPTITYNYLTVTSADLTATWTACDNVDMTDAIGRAYFAELGVNAAAFPTTPNEAADPPVVGANWAPATGGTATSAFTHTANSAAPLAWPVTIAAGNWYQILFTITNTNQTLSTQVQWHFRNGATVTTGQQLLRASALGSTTINVLASANFTHLVAVPTITWEGVLTLTRITRRAATTTALENSETLRLKNWSTIIRGDNSRYDGGGGRVASGANNIAFGWNAMQDLSTGTQNIAIGTEAMSQITTASNNVAVGYWAGTISNGSQNVAVGAHALRDNTIGSNNVAVGHLALASTGAQSGNVAVGQAAQELNSLGNGNVAVGYQALRSNQVGVNSTAVGYQALSACLVDNNDAFGFRALQGATYASANVALGYYALNANGWGNGNTAVGHCALQNVSNHWNAALGYYAGRYMGTGTAANADSTHGIFIGSDCRPLAAGSQREIVIGAGAVGGGSASVTIGTTAYTGTHRTNVAWTVGLSDVRGKENIELADLDRCLDAVKRLPVKRWRWRDFVGDRQDKNETGWLADDVEHVFPKSVNIVDEHFPDRDLKDCKHHNAHHVALPTLWGAVQRLIEKNEALEREVSELRHGINRGRTKH